MADNTGRGAQRAMLAVGLLLAGGILFALSTVAKTVNNAFGGVSSAEPEAPAKAAPTPDPATGVIHVQDGDPLPPATPISKRARANAPPPAPPAPAAASSGHSPAEMSHDELVAEVNALRAQVAALEAQQAAARAALGH